MDIVTSIVRAEIDVSAPTPAEIELAIDAALDALWGDTSRRPEVSEMKFEGEKEAWLDLKFTIELDDELELPFEMPDADTLQTLHLDLEGYAAEVGAVCAEVVSNAEGLRAAQSAMRRRVEAFSREMAAEGLNLPLCWLSLAPYDHWIEPAIVRFDIALVGLGDHLGAEDIRAEASLDDNLAAAFDHALDTQRSRARQVAENLAAGADGRVDALTLALIAAQPDPLSTIQIVAMRDNVELGNGASLHWTGGVLRSSGSLPGGIKWCEDRITLSGRWFSAATAATMTGRPASEIIDHPAFSGMIIREVFSDIAAGWTETFVDLETPVSFFKTSDGQAWPISGVGAA